jgi:steroid delta-isomerase-like uncharacterized protein
MSPDPHFTQAPDQLTEMSASGAAAKTHQSPPDAREVLARFLAAINAEDYAALDGLIAPDAVEHDPAAGQHPGALGYRTLFGDLRRALPDLHVEADHILASGDEVAVAYTMTGTHTGREFRGAPADGAGINVRGILMARMVDGLIVERWGASDELTLCRQLGVRD